MEKISVIVPVYKVEKYLDRCVQSIVDQTYSNLEIILVDDGSPDNCGAMCDAWAEKDPRIIVIHKENGGLSDARNAGLAVAHGDLISFVDSDDWLDPAFLLTLYTTLVENHADISECSVSYVDETGNPLWVRGTANTPIMDKITAHKHLILEAGIYQTVWNKLYRRSVLENILFEKGKCNEDDFWTYQVFDRMKKLAVVQEPLYFYLQRSSSIMGMPYSTKRLDGLEARFRRMEYLQKYDELAQLARVHLQNNCMFHYQCALKWLNDKDLESAKVAILAIMQKTPPVTESKNIKFTQRLWLRLFALFPDLTAKVRNILNIGL